MLIKRYIPAITWAIIILALTLTPGQFLPKVDYWSVVSLDKYVHFFIFCIQVLLLFWGAEKGIAGLISQKKKFVLFLAGVLFGFIIEIIQTFIPSRSFEINDLLANTVGCSIGALFYIIFRKRRSIGI